MKLPNPVKSGVKLGLRIGAAQCRQHNKYTCKTSRSETKNAAAHIKKQR